MWNPDADKCDQRFFVTAALLPLALSSALSPHRSPPPLSLSPVLLSLSSFSSSSLFPSLSLSLFLLSSSLLLHPPLSLCAPLTHSPAFSVSSFSYPSLYPSLFLSLFPSVLLSRSLSLPPPLSLPLTHRCPVSSRLRGSPVTRCADCLFVCVCVRAGSVSPCERCAQTPPLHAGLKGTQEELCCSSQLDRWAPAKVLLSAALAPDEWRTAITRRLSPSSGLIGGLPAHPCVDSAASRGHASPWRKGRMSRVCIVVLEEEEEVEASSFRSREPPARSPRHGSDADSAQAKVSKEILHTLSGCIALHQCMARRRDPVSFYHCPQPAPVFLHN